MPRIEPSAPARPQSCSTSRRSPPSICAAADRARGKPIADAAPTVERVDAIALSGGSAFGLDATSGVQAWLREQGRGYAIGEARVPIVPGAILFDLLRRRQEMGPLLALPRARLSRPRLLRLDFALGSAGAGLGATTANLKGGIGSASATTRGRRHGRRPGRRQRSRQSSPSATDRISGRRRSSRTTSSADAAGRKHSGRTRWRSGPRAVRARPPPSHWSQLTRS